MTKAQTLISYQNWPRTFSVVPSNFNWIEIISFILLLCSLQFGRNFLHVAKISSIRWHSRRVVDNCRQHKMRVIHSMIVYRISKHWLAHSRRKQWKMTLVDRKNENQSETRKETVNEWDGEQKEHFYTNMSNVQVDVFFFISNGKRYLHRFVSRCFLAVPPAFLFGSTNVIIIRCSVLFVFILFSCPFVAWSRVLLVQLEKEIVHFSVGRFMWPTFIAILQNLLHFFLAWSSLHARWSSEQYLRFVLFVAIRRASVCIVTEPISFISFFLLRFAVFHDSTNSSANVAGLLPRAHETQKNVW